MGVATLPLGIRKRLLQLVQPSLLPLVI